MPDILGQEAALSRLSGMIDAGKVPSALLLWGPDGVGKLLAAHWFAGKLGCGPHDVTVCDKAFQAALEQEEPEKQRTIKVDTIRELTRRASLKSGSGNWKVFIVDNAQDLVEEAANALLKELEEPEDRTVWILITSRKERLLRTVQSRCQSVGFAPLPDAVLARIAEAQGLVDANAARRWTAAAEGSLARLVRLARFGALVDESRSGPAGYWAVSQGLPRDLIQAREMTEGVLDALTAETAASLRARPTAETGRKAAELLRLKRALKQNASPQMIVQLALLESAI